MNNGLTLLKQVGLSVLARRKKWIVLVTLLGLALFAPVAYWMSQEPPRYRTSALILIESRPDRSPLFQEVSPYRPLAVQLAILNSRSLAEAVLESLPRASVEDLIENPYARDYVQDFQNWLRRVRGEEPVVESPQRRALIELQSARVRFAPHGASGIVSVFAEASRPRVALDIASTYIDVLMARTRTFNVDDTKVMREELQQQYSQLTQALAASEESLRLFTLSRGGVKVPARNAETVQRLSQVENALAEVHANKNIAQGRYAAMKAKLEALPAPPPAVAAKAAASPAPQTSVRVQRLRARLAQLEAQLLDQQMQYTDEHPRVIATKRQITEAQQELGDAVKENPAPITAASSPAVPAQDRAAFADAVAALESSILSLSAQEEALRNQAASLTRSLSGLSKDELEFARLGREVESNRRLSELVGEKLRTVRLREQGEMKVVKVIDPPSAPLPAANTKRLKLLTFALMAALVLGVGTPAVAEYFNRPIETDQDIRQLTGLTVLAQVPQVQSRRALLASGAIAADESKHEDYFLFAEAFRRLRVEIELLAREAPRRRILVTSALPGEGKSTVVVNLGLAFGEIGKHVILADADFHRPSLHRTFKTPNTKGFSDLLAGGGTIHDSISPVAEGVWVAPRGGSSITLSRAGLGSRRLGDVLARMSDEADYVLIDSSPILLIPDNLYVAAAVDAVLLVVHAGSTRPRDLVRAREIFEKAGTPVMGVVLNRVPLKRMTAHSRYYRHYKAYIKSDSKGERSGA